MSGSFINAESQLGVGGVGRGWVSRAREPRRERRAAEVEETWFLIITQRFSYMTSYGPPRHLMRCTCGGQQTC